jgi:tRNA 2-(methylsulfanyl)-N6-isopentenyladenosine37 hydroxylase
MAMMFRLQLPTDPRWVNIAEMNEEEILTDHAYCELKAAATALSLTRKFYDYPEIVSKMTELACEEMEHFNRVHAFILKRGYKWLPEKKDEYVNKIAKQVKTGGGRIQQLVDHLLVAALIEARSCERFKILSEQIKDQEFAGFYRELMESEAGHYTLFITLARNVEKREKVDQRWEEILRIEAEVMSGLENKSRIHG